MAVEEFVDDPSSADGSLSTQIEAIALLDRIANHAGALQAVLTGRLAADPRLWDLKGRCYLAEELSARLGLSRYEADRRVSESMALTMAHPQLLQAMDDGVVGRPTVRALLDETAVLPDAEARAVAEHVLSLDPAADRDGTDSADTSEPASDDASTAEPDGSGPQPPGDRPLTAAWMQELSPAEARDITRRAVIAVDPGSATVRHERERRRRSVSIEPERDGMSRILAYLPAEAAMTVWTALGGMSAQSGPEDPRTLGQRRADALTDLFAEALDTGRGPYGPLTRRKGRRDGLTVIMDAPTLLGLAADPAAGYGPVPAEIGRKIASDATWRRMLADPRGQVLGIEPRAWTAGWTAPGPQGDGADPEDPFGPDPADPENPDPSLGPPDPRRPTNPRAAGGGATGDRRPGDDVPLAPPPDGVPLRDRSPFDDTPPPDDEPPPGEEFPPEECPPDDEPPDDIPPPDDGPPPDDRFPPDDGPPPDDGLPPDGEPPPVDILPPDEEPLPEGFPPDDVFLLPEGESPPDDDPSADRLLASGGAHSLPGTDGEVLRPDATAAPGSSELADGSLDAPVNRHADEQASLSEGDPRRVWSRDPMPPSVGDSTSRSSGGPTLQGSDPAPVSDRRPVGFSGQRLPDPAGVGPENSGEERAPDPVGYRPSAWLVALVRARDRRCAFPGCRMPAERCDLDHIVPFDAALPARLQTTAANLAPLCRRHHEAKTTRTWSYTRQAATGLYTWTSPTGHTYTRPADPTRPPWTRPR